MGVVRGAVLVVDLQAFQADLKPNQSRACFQTSRPQLMKTSLEESGYTILKDMEDTIFVTLAKDIKHFVTVNYGLVTDYKKEIIKQKNCIAVVVCCCRQPELTCRRNLGNLGNY